MKRQIPHLLVFGIIIMSAIAPPQANAQCAATAGLGGAINMFTQLENHTSPVAVDKNLNTVIFLHRHNSNQLGGNSGNLRYDISTNGGSSWSSNLGVLNPNSYSFARYPSVAIYNPASNTVATNAYLGYFAPTTDAGYWDGLVTGVRKLDGTGNTENYNQPSSSSYLVANSMVKGAQGVFWALDKTSDGIYPTGGINVYKGTWNGSNDIVWTTQAVFTPPFNTSAFSSPVVKGQRIAFDPSGTTGWICLMTHLTTQNSAYGYYPVFYKTVNGGSTWTGPITINLNQLSCISASMSPGYIASAYGDIGLTVDNSGNPHLFAVVGHNDNNYGLMWNMWYSLFDITQANSQWVARPVSAIKGAPYSHTGSNSGAVVTAMCPQAARSADGTKLFFSWTDNSSYSQGTANYSPNLFSRAYDVGQDKWTPVKDFTSCNTSVAGEIWYAHMAEHVLEPSSGQYKLAPVYGVMNSQYDPDLPVTFNFLDNCTFSAAEFSIAPAGLSIAQGTSALLCPGNTMNLQVIGSFPQINWSNGSTSSTNPITSPGLYTVSASNGCQTSTASIMVTQLSVSIPGTYGICAGQSVTLTANGNATAYSWMPGSVPGPSIGTSPSISTTYTVTGAGTGCALTATATVSVQPTPVLVITTNKEIVCPGETAILFASGASVYSWHNGPFTASFAVNPPVNTTYTVTGTSSGGCISTHTYMQKVEECLSAGEAIGDPALSIFPNPNNGSFSIDGPAWTSLAIYDQLGRLVSVFSNAEMSPGGTLVVSRLPAGVYLLGVRDKMGSTVYRKVIVE